QFFAPNRPGSAMGTQSLQGVVVENDQDERERDGKFLGQQRQDEAPQAQAIAARDEALIVQFRQSLQRGISQIEDYREDEEEPRQASAPLGRPCDGLDAEGMYGEKQTAGECSKHLASGVFARACLTQ